MGVYQGRKSHSLRKAGREMLGASLQVELGEADEADDDRKQSLFDKFQRLTGHTSLL